MSDQSFLLSSQIKVTTANQGISFCAVNNIHFIAAMAKIGSTLQYPMLFIGGPCLQASAMPHAARLESRP
jgi:hypothetical protein